MFLRWASYRDKAGRVRLYPRLISSRRQGKQIRHIKAGTSFRIILEEGAALSEQMRRDLWTRLDRELGNRPSAVARANIERTFAAKVGPRPPATPFERAMWALWDPRHPLPPSGP